MILKYINKSITINIPPYNIISPLQDMHTPTRHAYTHKTRIHPQDTHTPTRHAYTHKTYISIWLTFNRRLKLERVLSVYTSCTLNVSDTYQDKVQNINKYLKRNTLKSNQNTSELYELLACHTSCDNHHPN